MLSQYQELLDKRRLQRKRGNKPLPELPPFKVLPGDQYHDTEPSSPADSVFGSSQSHEFRQFREPVVLNQRSPSVHSRESATGTSPRRIFTPPPVASIYSTVELGQNQPGTLRTSHYLSQLTPFSVTPRKRMYAESLVTVDEAVVEESVRNKRTQSHHSGEEGGILNKGYPVQDMEDQSAGSSRSAMDHANLSESDIAHKEPLVQPVEKESMRSNHPTLGPTNSVENEDRERLYNEDTEMLDINVKPEIPDEWKAADCPPVDNGPDTLSIHDLSIDDNDDREHTPKALLDSARSPSVHSVGSDSGGDQNARKSVVSELVNRQSPEPQQTFTNNSNRASDQLAAKGSQQEAGNDRGSAESNRDIGISIEATGETQDQLGRPLLIKEPKDPKDKGKQLDDAIQEPMQYSFNDDTVDYGDDDQESNLVDPGNEANPGNEAEPGNDGEPGNEANEAESANKGEPVNDDEMTPNDVLKYLRKMATANTVNVKKRLNLAQVHIKTISNTVFDKTKKKRSQTSDAHEKSIIEDYYYTLNDDLKKYYKSYVQYEQLASARRRLLGFYRKKDQEFLGEIKQEASLRKHIDDLREKITELDTTLS
ncbi:hypothetical protein BD408DRAFT_418951, partial [Parasitella parasitica]